MYTRIKQLRTTLKLTQAEFGRNIGLSRSLICLIEQNQVPITERNIINICGKFNVNENWLRYGKGEVFNIDLSYQEFYKIYNQLSKPLQNFLLSTTKELLKTQSELNL